ncbi:hypothetical protein ACTU6V_05355 [Microbacterium sp. A204]|uniref:hypothetical protein n=1 Tax=Microbacterium sp. A204 TaxID=3457321 RepID=UPI003FD602E0
MTAKHRDPEYYRSAKIIRQQVAAQRRAGEDVICRRCFQIIDIEQRFDVGHIDPDGGPSLSNLRPEHRRCNRSAGGKYGAARRAARRGGRRPEPARLGGIISSGSLNW